MIDELLAELIEELLAELIEELSAELPIELVDETTLELLDDGNVGVEPPPPHPTSAPPDMARHKYRPSFDRIIKHLSLLVFGKNLNALSR